MVHGKATWCTSAVWLESAAWLPMAPWWLLIGFFACHVTFEALNEALVTIPGVPKSGSAWYCDNLAIDVAFKVRGWLICRVHQS